MAHKNSHNHQNSGLPAEALAKAGQTLVETLVVITLLGLLAVPLLISLNRLNRKYHSLSLNAQANLITQQNLEIAANIIQSAPDWQFIPQPDTPTLYSPPIAPDWNFTTINSPVPVQGRYQTQITIQPVCRDNQNQLTAYQSGCTQDPFSIEIISQTFWQESGRNQSSNMSTIFTNPHPYQI